MRYFFIVGEASGDLHASLLMKKLKLADTEAAFIGMGGDLMESEGCQIIQHYREMAFMGVVAVVSNLDKVRHNFQIAKRILKEEKIDVLVLVDYPSFNLSMAQFAKKNITGIKVWYYIPPKIWAWKTWRVHNIAKYTDRIMGIFPFEVDFYAKYGYKCEYVGNPTFEEIGSYKASHPTITREKIIAILPGSRTHEVKKCLPRMVDAALSFGDYKIVIAKAKSIDIKYYTPYLSKQTTIADDPYALLQTAQVAIVNSGTATLEAALLGCPQVSVYHVAMGRILNILRPILFKVPCFTLVNIIAQKKVIKELFAYLFTIENVREEVKQILLNEEYRNNMLMEYQYIAEKLK